MDEHRVMFQERQVAEVVSKMPFSKFYVLVHPVLQEAENRQFGVAASG